MVRLRKAKNTYIGKMHSKIMRKNSLFGIIGIMIMFYLYSKYVKQTVSINRISQSRRSADVPGRIFSDAELSSIYETEIKSRINETYLQNFRNITRENINRLLPTDVTLENANKIRSYERFFIMKDFQYWIRKHNIICDRFASINGPDPEDVYINCSTSKIYFTYKEGENGSNDTYADLYVLNIEDHKKIDFWNIQQTFEHIHNGHFVLQRLYDNTKCNGYIFVSVPIYNIPHMLPLHFYSYTPMGLVTMFLEIGWKILDLGLWGNHEYLIELLNKQTWPTLLDAIAEQERTNYTRDFFSNDPFYGFQVWLLGRKLCPI